MNRIRLCVFCVLLSLAGGPTAYELQALNELNLLRGI